MAPRRNRLPGLSTTGRRKNRSKVETTDLGLETSRIKYRTSGVQPSTGSDSDSAIFVRHYIPSFINGEIYGSAGPSIIGNYQEAKFLPGTTARWIPNCGTQTSGRVYVCFITNSELMASIPDLITASARINFIRSVGNYQSFPVWQESNVVVPTTLRRRMFEVNTTSSLDDIDLERSCQVLMFSIIAGAPANTICGGFDYTDSVMMSGPKGAPST